MGMIGIISSSEWDLPLPKDDEEVSPVPEPKKRAAPKAKEEKPSKSPRAAEPKTKGRRTTPKRAVKKSVYADNDDEMEE